MSLQPTTIGETDPAARALQLVNDYARALAAAIPEGAPALLSTFGVENRPALTVCDDEHDGRRCTLVAGHQPAQLHEHHTLNDQCQYLPPARRWWRMSDGTVIA